MTLEEALEVSGAEPVNDIFLINPETRTITVPETEKIFGVSHDGNTERKHFRCPKVVGDNIDLSTMHLYINYQNANGDKYPYLVEDVQPDSTNPYAKGDKVTHNGKTWQSTTDNNVWEPGVYGWEEVHTN